MILNNFYPMPGYHSADWRTVHSVAVTLTLGHAFYGHLNVCFMQQCQKAVVIPWQ